MASVVADNKTAKNFTYDGRKRLAPAQISSTITFKIPKIFVTFLPVPLGGRHK